MFRIVIATLLLFSTLCLESFCKDAHCLEEAGHTEMTCCHSASNPAVAPMTPVLEVIFASIEVAQSYQSSYENPILLSLLRPPIVLS